MATSALVSPVSGSLTAGRPSSANQKEMPPLTMPLFPPCPVPPFAVPPRTLPSFASPPLAALPAELLMAGR
ncbi:hypothetical protein GCM10010524_05750 [Streptomyces mexicanus]